MGFIANIFGKIKLSTVLLPTIILMFIYFSFYAIKGERGFVRYVRLNDEVSQARVLSEKYAREKSEWEEKVKLLSPESLDLDMLDERAHVVLNMVGAQEFVILDDSDEETDSSEE
jgi:cell division protein FtsB